MKSVIIFHGFFLWSIFFKIGNNEGIEAYTSNIYSRRVLSGEFQVVNNHLLRDLTELDLWDDDMKNKLIAANGSIQGIEEIPDEIKALYKTVWEISQKTVYFQDLIFHKIFVFKISFFTKNKIVKIFRCWKWRRIAEPSSAKVSH